MYVFSLNTNLSRLIAHETKWNILYERNAVRDTQHWFHIAYTIHFVVYLFICIVSATTIPRLYENNLNFGTFLSSRKSALNTLTVDDKLKTFMAVKPAFTMSQKWTQMLDSELITSHYVSLNLIFINHIIQLEYLTHAMWELFDFLCVWLRLAYV